MVNEVQQAGYHKYSFGDNRFSSGVYLYNLYVQEHFNTELPLETGEELTKFARDILREKFLLADIGISGANLIAAETGSLLLVESEGNIRLTTHLPATHIAISGVEKIIENFSDISVFVELLAASGTGQALTSYTNILTFFYNYGKGSVRFIYFFFKNRNILYILKERKQL